MKYIIDTDYSTNSLSSLKYLITNKLDIVAITLVSGINKQRPIDIKLKLTQFLKELNINNCTTIPIYLGAQQAYINYQQELADSDVLNPYNKEGSIDTKEPVPEVDLSQSASLCIIDLIKKHQKDLTILTLSSLTNLSLSVVLDPTINDMFNKLIITGGSTIGNGNSGVSSEANFRADPIAAKNCILYYKNVLLIPIDLFDSESFRKVDFSKSLNCGEVTGEPLQLIGSMIALDCNRVLKKESFPADVDIVGKYTRGAIAMEKYSYLEKGDFNRIDFVTEVKFD